MSEFRNDSGVPSYEELATAGQELAEAIKAGHDVGIRHAIARWDHVYQRTAFSKVARKGTDLSTKKGETAC